MVELGLTWDQVDDWTLPRVAALNRHFEKIPSLRVAVAACAAALGVKFPEPARAAGPAGAAPVPEFAELPEFE